MVSPLMSCRTERSPVCSAGPEHHGAGAGEEQLPGPSPATHPPQGADDGDPGVFAPDGQQPPHPGQTTAPSPSLFTFTQAADKTNKNPLNNIYPVLAEQRQTKYINL